MLLITTQYVCSVGDDRAKAPLTCRMHSLASAARSGQAIIIPASCTESGGMGAARFDT